MIGVGTRRQKNRYGQESTHRFDRLVKTGYCKRNESLGFTNYFLAQKVRAKVSTTDETLGSKQILALTKDAKKKINAGGKAAEKS